MRTRQTLNRKTGQVCACQNTRRVLKVQYKKKGEQTKTGTDFTKFIKKKKFRSTPKKKKRKH